jgi:hypothetical protein
MSAMGRKQTFGLGPFSLIYPADVCRLRMRDIRPFRRPRRGRYSIGLTVSMEGKRALRHRLFVTGCAL